MLIYDTDIGNQIVKVIDLWLGQTLAADPLREVEAGLGGAVLVVLLGKVMQKRQAQAE